MNDFAPFLYRSKHSAQWALECPFSSELRARLNMMCKLAGEKGSLSLASAMSTSTVRRDTRSPRRGRGRGGISFTNPRISARNDNLQTSGLSTPPSSKNNRASPRPRGRGAGGNNRSFGRSSPSREALQKAESDMDPDAPGLMTAAQRAKRFGASNKSVIYDQVPDFGIVHTFVPAFNLDLSTVAQASPC